MPTTPTARVPSAVVAFGDDKRYRPLIGGATIARQYQTGEMVGRRADGFTQEMNDSAALDFLGLVAEHPVRVDGEDANGAKHVLVRRPYRIEMPLDTGTASWILHAGAPLYASDGGHVSLSAGAFGNLVGYLTHIAGATPETMVGNVVGFAPPEWDNFGGTGEVGGNPVGASTAAAGTTTADAGVLPAATSRTYPTTGADDTKGVRINAADKVTGRTLFIANTVANKILKVYPPTGGTINGAAANAAFSSASGQGVTIRCLDATANTWAA